MSANLLKECRTYWEGLDHCGCYSPDIVKIVESATDCLFFVEAEPDGEPGGAILVCPDGYYGIEEYRDYTGHGCQCGSQVGALEGGPFKDLRTCIRLGISQSVREIYRAKQKK